MQHGFFVIGLAATMFLAILLSVALKPKPALKVSGVCSIITAVGGLIIYGYGYAHVFDDPLLAGIRTVWSASRMFVSANEYGAISSAPLFQYSWAQVVFWCLHFLGFYSTVSTALYALGSGLLHRIRLRIFRKQDLHLIYGLTDNSLAFGKALAAKSGGGVVFVDHNASAPLSNAVSDMGGVRRFDPDALAGNRRLLKSLGLRPGKRKLTLYALGGDSSDNLRYAKQLLAALEQQSIAPSQTSLVIQCRDDAPAIRLQTEETHYGYGFVTVYQPEDLVARLLVQKFPPCDTLSFTPEGCATEDFEALVIGFGRLGQAVLKQLVMTGQFVGSRFQADVFAPDCLAVNGYFTQGLSQLLNHYSLAFHPYDGRSPQLFAHLAQRGQKLKYIVLCAGSEENNLEITRELQQFLRSRQLEIPIYRCSYAGISTTDPDTLVTVSHPIYHPDVLSTAVLDEMAMLVNHYYQGANGTTPVEDWMRCDYFSRTSCRAFADNLSATLRAARKTREQAENGDWSFSQTHLETLSMMEHLRWCAFHYCMGYAPMEAEEFNRRCALYWEQKEKGLPTLRITKNAAGKTHACLVDWDQLDVLSAAEMAVTGTDPCYKFRDTENILAVPALLKSRI